jgi:hypothetical protein
MPDQLSTPLTAKFAIVAGLAVLALAVVAATGALARPADPDDTSSATTSTSQTTDAQTAGSATSSASSTSNGRGSKQDPPPGHRDRDGNTPPGHDNPAPDPDPEPDPRPDPAPGPDAPSLFGGTRHFGVATPSNGWDGSELDHVAAITGEQPTIVLHYLGFVDELHAGQLDGIQDTGAMSLLTWEPFDWRAGRVNQPRYRLANIINGRFDAYVTRTARTIAAHGEPVLLRFAHEMNGAWYPWSEQVNGNRPGEYVAAWRHVHDLFTELGVDNVTWVWSPNVEFGGSQPLDGLYPGHDYVDAIALDGYNWGTTAASGWQSPGEVFDATLATVRELSPGTPLLIGETSSSEVGGDKAAWNTSLFTWLEDNPDIEALVWFQLDKETDWRIDSSRESADAFGPALAGWLG